MATILLVEDDLSLNRGIEFALNQEGHCVHGVVSRSRAREILSSMLVDLIILDVGLPDGDGYDLCKEIRCVSDIPILFLTALDSELDVVRGLDLGGDDFMTKPFRLRELISRVNALLRRTVTRNFVLDSESSLALEEDTLVAVKNGTKIQLSKTEFRLLRYLMRNPRVVLSKEQILQSLWDIDGGYIDENTVAVNIRRLREKIEANPGHPQLIQTIRGVGYRWDG